MADLPIAAIRVAVLMERKFTSFLQESQKNLPLTIEPRVLLPRPEVPPEPQSLSPRGVCGELALEPTSLAYRSSLYSWPELLSSQ
jgi:hypothetical protein